MTNLSSPRKPKKRAAFIALLGALAAAVLVVAILPAQFGVDPLGTSKLFGIDTYGIGARREAPAFVNDSTGNPLPVSDEQMTHYAGAANYNRVVLTLAPKEFVEYKYHLLKGASLHFSWEASAPLEHDAHGEPDTYPDDPALSYDQSSVQKASGSLIAPFTGRHGWYWNNKSDKPVTVTVTGIGFYDYAMELRTKGFRRRHPVTPVTRLSAP